MARAVEDNWSGPLTGLVVTRYGHAVTCSPIEIVEAGHPYPDESGATAARRMLEMAANAGPERLVLALMSGGGSSLLSLPAPGLDLADLASLNRTLLKAGADIAAINTVRKHLSAVAGGRLALAAYPAEVLTLVISDVPGDDPSMVASGPTLPDRTTWTTRATCSTGLASRPLLRSQPIFSRE
jgi:hydroxypyruvate reductase